MELRKDDFPVALQAYDIRDTKEQFVAEQVVNTQAEADSFVSLYAGKLIKKRDVRPVESRKVGDRRTKTTIPGWVIFVLVVILAVVVAYFAGLLPFSL